MSTGIAPNGAFQCVDSSGNISAQSINDYARSTTITKTDYSGSTDQEWTESFVIDGVVCGSLLTIIDNNLTGFEVNENDVIKPVLYDDINNTAVVQINAEKDQQVTLKLT